LYTVYTCALERDGLWQGKLYFTSRHLCFYGKVFSKAAKVMIDFQDVVSVEKKNTAGMFPNAIRIVTNNSKVII